MSKKVKTEEAKTTETEQESPTANTAPIIYDPKATLLPTYDRYPQWLDQSKLPPTARIIYKNIYNRAISVSLENSVQFTNDEGHIFVIYTNDDLADDCGLGLSAVKAAKSIMVELGYIAIEPIAHSSAIRIYPRVPVDAPTYKYKTAKKDTSNSSFDIDDFFAAAVHKSLGDNTYPSKD